VLLKMRSELRRRDADLAPTSSSPSPSPSPSSGLNYLHRSWRWLPARRHRLLHRRARRHHPSSGLLPTSSLTRSPRHGGGWAEEVSLKPDDRLCGWLLSVVALSNSRRGEMDMVLSSLEKVNKNGYGAFFP
jgi:hypothetical protein